jgi:predicted TIM-barrel fold metal-dependent hydrolase
MYCCARTASLSDYSPSARGVLERFPKLKLIFAHGGNAARLLDLAP